MTASTNSAQSNRFIAPATAAWAGTLIGLTALYWFLSLQMHADVLSDTAYAASYWFGTSLQAIFAAVIITVALRVGLGQGVGKQWFLIGLGAVSVAVGDVIWTILELHMGLDPYPSLADPFYILQYGFFLAAMVLAIKSYRHLVPIRTPLIIAGVIGLVLGGGVYAVLLGPHIFPAGVAELGFWGLVISTLYPLGDVFLILTPAIALALVVRQLGAGRLGWPWWIAIAGALLYAITDTGYAYADWAGTGFSTTLEMGWAVSNLLFALAALVARDVYRVR